jgi:hypothetical protein
MAAQRRNKERDRLAAYLADSLPDSGGGYEVSSAYTAPERKRLLGLWSIEEHLVEGRPYVEIFAERAMKGAGILEPVYASVYDFRDSICVKRVRISGLAELPEGRTEFLYSMSVAISWELGRGVLLVRPELGYQSTSLGGQIAAVKELAASGELSRIAYRLEGGSLFLKEGNDSKRLARAEP